MSNKVIVGYQPNERSYLLDDCVLKGESLKCEWNTFTSYIVGGFKKDGFETASCFISDIVAKWTIKLK